MPKPSFTWVRNGLRESRVSAACNTPVPILGASEPHLDDTSDGGVAFHDVKMKKGKKARAFSTSVKKVSFEDRAHNLFDLLSVEVANNEEEENMVHLIAPLSPLTFPSDFKPLPFARVKDFGRVVA